MAKVGNSSGALLPNKATPDNCESHFTHSSSNYYETAPRSLPLRLKFRSPAGEAQGENSTPCGDDTSADVVLTGQSCSYKNGCFARAETAMLRSIQSANPAALPSL
jgi:hypothetical protein